MGGCLYHQYLPAELGSSLELRIFTLFCWVIFVGDFLRKNPLLPGMGGTKICREVIYDDTVLGQLFSECLVATNSFGDIWLNQGRQVDIF